MNLVGCVIDSCDEQILANDRSGLRNHLCRHLQYFPFGCGYCIENGRKIYYTTESSLISHTNSIHESKEIKIFEDINERKEQRLTELIGQMSANGHTTPEKQETDQSTKRDWSDEREDLENLQILVDTRTALSERYPSVKKQKVVSYTLPSPQKDETISKAPTRGKSPAKARKSISPRKSPTKFPFLPGQKSLFDYYAPKSTTNSGRTATDSNNIEQTPNEPENPEETPATEHDMQCADVPPSMKGFLCKKCDKVTGFKLFHAHLISHVESPFVCVPCGMSWQSYTSIRSHIAAKHSSKEVKDFHKVGLKEEIERLWVDCYGAREFNCALCDAKKAGSCSPKHIKMHLKKDTNGLSFEQMGYKCFGQYSNPGKEVLARNSYVCFGKYAAVSGEEDIHQIEQQLEQNAPIEERKLTRDSSSPNSTTAHGTTISDDREHDSRNSNSILPSDEANVAIPETASPHPLPTPNSTETFEGLNCMKCNQSVALSSLSRHLLKHTTEAAYKCVSCNQAFRSDIGIKEHIKKQHPGLSLTEIRRPGLDEELIKLAPLCYGLEKLFCDICKDDKMMSCSHHHVKWHLKGARDKSFAQMAYDCFGHHTSTASPRPISPQPARRTPSPQLPPTASVLAEPPPLESDHNESVYQPAPVLICSLCSIPTALPEGHVFQCHMQMRQYPFQCAMCEFKAVTPDSFPKHYQMRHGDRTELQTVVTDLDALKGIHDRVKECFK